jgi:hypothetical protein
MLSHEREERGASHFIPVSRHQGRKKNLKKHVLAVAAPEEEEGKVLYADMWRCRSAYFSIRQHTSAYVSIRQQSAYGR